LCSSPYHQIAVKKPVLEQQEQLIQEAEQVEVVMHLEE
jgi:translation elongation factor P/translation initiation factor 5A